MKNAIAKVSSLSGEVFARTADGTLRRLRTGDSITEGETIVTGQNGRARLILADGREINIGPRESVAMNAEVAANPPPGAEDSAFFSRPREVRNLARALQEGEDLDDLIDEEGPAAGLVGDGSEGHSFVEFLRISESIDSQNSYRFDAGDSSIPPPGAAQADVLDTVPLTLSAELDPASDSGIPGDSITNDNTPGIIGTSKPGASITVTMPGTGEVLRTTAATDGSWRVEAGQALADGAQNISVVATERTGNTLSTTVFVVIDTATPNDGQAPIVTIIEDANDDGFINASELNGDVDVRIAFTGSKVDIGDIIRVSDGSPRIEHVISAADQARGYIETRFAAPANGETITVTADITDAAGNTSAPGSDSAMIDIDVPNSGQAPDVEITEDANNDGFINRAEASGPADVKVSFNKDKVDVGDTVRVSDGTTTKDLVISATDKANGFVTTDFPLPSDGSTLTVSAHIFDPAGNRSATGTDFAKVDLSALLNLQLVISEDENNDGFINASELKGSVGVDITLPTDAIAGDLITIHATGNPTRTITLIQPQIDSGKLTIELNAQANGTRLEVSAQVTDAAGNKSNIATDAAVINTTPPSLTVQLAPSSDSGTQGDNLTNDNTPALTGRSDPGTRITVVIPSTGEQLTAITDGNGNWQVTPTLPLPDATSIIEVTATDSIGNSSNTTLPLTIDTTQFSGQAAAIREDANNDGFINATELQGDIDVRVTIPNGAVIGDTLTVSATGNTSQIVTITAAQIATGFVDLAFTPTANNTDFIVNASIADAARNTSGPVSDNARIQLSPPDAPIVTIVEDANGDGWINAAELQGNIDVRIGLPTGASDGDILLTTINGVTQAPITLTAADIANPHIALPGIANPGEGTALTVTAQIRDTAGNLGSVGSNNARVDTLPPAVTARLDPTSDSGTRGDGITNDNTPTISGTGEAGASITVTLPTGEALRTTVANAGLWSVTPQQPLAEGPATIFVTTTDVAGNAANTTVDLTIDTHIPNNKLAPAVTITEDANGDGFINRAEASGPADVRVSFNKDNVDVGDTARISDGSTVRNIVITAADKANGFVTTDFPLPADGNTLNVSAYLFDAAGNESATGSTSAIVDITDYTGLGIRISEDENDDGFINIAELKDNDIDVRITIPQGAAVGDTLTVTAVGNVDKVFTLSAAQIATGFIDTKFNPTSNNTDFKVTAAITDPAGNTAGPVEDSARLQLSAPAEPIVTVLEDANNDGWINAAELRGNIDVSVTLPATAVAGNTLITTVNGVTQAPITLTQADIVKGSYALPGIPNPGEGTTLTVTAQIRDAAGNLGNIASDSARIDTRIPNGGQAPDVFITDDINNDGFINRAEASGPADVRVAFNKDQVDVGDTVRVSDATTTKNLVVTAADQANGFVTTDFPMPINGDTLTVTAFIFDPAGNQSATGTDFAKVDLSALLNLQLVITEDENNDGFINASELKGSIGVDITLPTDAVAGDLVTINATGNATQTITLIQPQIDSGKLTIELNAPANGTNLEVSAQVTDAAGNKSNIATDSAIIAIDPPGAPTVTILEDANNDGYINRAELQGDIDVRIGLPTGTQAGDILRVSANNTPIAPITLSQADITTGSVDIALPSPGDGQQLLVTARVEDFAGNLSPTGSGSALIDITQFSGLAITITEDENNDGFINLSELKDDDIDVRVTLPAGAAVGDTLTVSASGNVNQVFTLSAAQLAAGFINVKFNPTANNTDFVATAAIADAAGNAAGPVSDQARIQLSAPGLPIVTITEDANNDGWINAAELQGNIDVSVTLPATAAAGAFLITTVNGIVQPEILVTQADIIKGSIALPGIPNPGEGVTLTVTAQVRDSAGNLGAIGNDSATIDTRIPNDGVAPIVHITEDENNDGFISASELKGNADVRIEFDGTKVDIGDIVRVTDGTASRDITITAADRTNGFVTTDFVPPASGQTITVTAHIFDAAGNTTQPGSDSAIIDTDIPNNGLPPEVEITEDANNDGFINRAEASGPADVKVSFNKDKVDVGDTVRVSDATTTKNLVVTAADQANGFVTTDFPMPINGDTLTVTAFIFDPAGNQSATGTDFAKVDLSALLNLQLVITEDENNDGFINASELKGSIGVDITLPIDAVAGDLVTIHATGNATQTITLNQAQIDTGKLQLEFNAPPNGTKFEASAQVTDAAGNKSNIASDVATIAINPPGAPVITILEDINQDGLINRAELQGNIDARIAIPAGAIPGNILFASVNGAPLAPVTLTQDNITNGVNLALPNPGDGQKLDITAQVRDAAGNLSPTGSASTTIDITDYTGLGIRISEDENDDGFINIAELKDNDIDVRITIPQGAAVGDTLTVTAVGNVDKVFTLSAAQIATGFINTKFNPTSNNTDFKVTAAITDPAGNNAGPVEDSARLQLSAPAEPIVTILEDANNDGWINAAELRGNIDVSVTLPATAVAGNTLITTVNGVTQAPITLTQADILRGSFALPGIPNPGEGVTLTVTAQIRDAAGNLGNVASDSATIDTRIPNDGVAPIVVITEDANNNGRISAAELNGNVDVRIEFDGTKVDIGNIVRITDGTTSRDITITAADKTANHVLTNFVPPASGQTITVTAHIFDAAGNTTQPGSDSAIIDTDIPNNGLPPDVEITEDANNDGFINRAEASGPADVKVSFNKDKVDVGDTVRVSDGTTTKDLVVSATDKANGFVTTDFPLPSDGSTLTVSAHIFDPAGNRSATGTDFAKVDLSALLNLQLVISEDTNNDGFINASELKGSVGVDITLPTDAIAGDLVTIHATGNATQTITLIQPQIDSGKLTIELNAPANGTRLEVSAQVTDAAGNKSNIATDAAVINTTPPTLTVQLAPSSDSGTKGDNITNDATPTLIGITTPGARVTVSIPSTGEQQQTTADSSGNWQVTANQAMPDGTTPVVVTATDAIGNTSTTSLPLTIDTTQFTGLAVTIREDENNDGFINLSELKDGDIDVRVTLPNGAAIGDTLTVAASGNIARVFTLSAAQLAAGFIDVTFTPTANNTDFVATASIADAAGNSAGPVSDQARIQLSPPDAPIVTIIEDANNDGWINAAELQGDIDVRIELPGNVQAGDRLLTTVNGIARAEILITQADIDQGSIALPGIANPGEGSTLTVTAQVRDSAGNFGSIGDSQARIDTTPPALAAWLDPASDSGTQGDGITNDNTPTLSGTGEPGAAITVTLPGTGEVLKTSVSAGGTWTVTPTQPLADGTHLAQVGATDAAGNSSNATVALHIDTHIPNNRLAPTVIITEDANGDGYINRAEAIGNADVRVAFTADLVEVGDVVAVSAGGISREIAISSSDRSNGYVSTDFPMPANGATLTVSAFIVDRAGNTSDTGQASAIVDITDYQGLSIEITEDANNDGFINRSELQDNDIDVRVTLPNGAAVGDTLTATAVGNVDKVFTLTAAQLAAGFIDVKFNPTANNTDFRVTASIVDVAGNGAGPAEDTARILISPPSEPIVTILEDINNDGWINATERQGNIDVSVTLPATAVAGDTLLTSINGVAQANITITHADILKGSIALPGIPNPGDGVTLTVEARVKDAAGNIGNPGSDSATIDLAIPNNGEAPVVTILEDINNDGFINRAEASGNADVRIAFTAALVKAGDTVRVSDGTSSRDIVITPADRTNGYVDTDFPLPPDGATLTVSAHLFDPAGNRSATGTDFAKVDLSALLNLQLVITEDENNDGFINRSELRDDDIDVRVTLPNGAAVGDTLTVNASGNINQVFTLTAAQLAAGFIDVKFNPTANNTDFVATASIADAAGNSAGPVSDQARIQLSAPGLPIVTITEDANNDGWINAAELQGDIDVSVTLPATAVAGAMLVTTVNGVVQSEILISQADINKGSVALPGIANPGEGTTLTVTAQVRDSAGNLGAIGSDSAQIDTRIPNDGHAPVVVIAEDANSDGLISASELQGNVDVRIEFDGSKVDVGDIVRVTDGTSTRNIEVNDTDKAKGFVTTDFPPLAAGQTITLRARIEDPAGNRSDEGWQSALFSLVKLDNLRVTVSEEGLAGGIPDPAGNPSDNTDNAFATGNIGVSGNGGVPLEVSVSAPPEAITSGGQALSWSGAGTTASPLIGYAGGTEVIRLSIDSDGNYRVTLDKPIDHADGQDENVATLNFNLSVSDGRTTASAVLTLAIEDDSPKAVPEAEGGAMRHQDTNLMLIIDNSGSMNQLVAPQLSRLQIMKDSVQQLIKSYDMLGDVAVRIIVYSTTASTYTAGWVSASAAIAYVNNLGTGVATNYDAALLTAMQAFQAAGKIPGATNVSYFLSDGEPNARSDWDGSGPMANQVGIQPAEAAIWRAFLENNQINSFAFGMGIEVQQNSMAPVAYNGIDKTPTPAIVVSNERELASILRDTVNANFKGNFLDGSLHQGSGVGADGGYLNAFSIDGTSYFIDGSVNGSSAGSFDAATRKWTVFTQAGGKLVIDMDSGDYNYTPPIKDQATTENIAFSIIDNDGDSASSTLALTVQPPPDKIMGGTGNDTLVGTAGDDYIDGEAGDDLIIGGAGADILKGGAGSDTFQWSFGDQGNVGLPAQDRITDFTLGSGGDVLDLRDLLQGENADNLTEYLHFSAVGNNTLLQISSQGQFSGSNHAAMTDQEILLHGVTLNSLAGAGATDAQIISELLKANLKVDL